MTKQKTAAAVHDLSGFGKCSLTVALPILSAGGVWTSVLPTALLSTHTGGFTGYTCRDLTDDMGPFAAHWKQLGLSFDALYMGYLASPAQIGVVEQFIDDFKTKDNLTLIDPVLGDNGRMYTGFSPEMASGMARLCKKADLIVPNMTEAALLLGEEFRDGPYDRPFVERTLEKLARLGPTQVVLTGVWFSPALLGAAGFDAETGTVSYAFSPRQPGSWHGTGDVFASCLAAALLNDFSLKNAIQLAVDFVCGCIRHSREAATDQRFGVAFERELPALMRALGLLGERASFTR